MPKTSLLIELPASHIFFVFLKSTKEIHLLLPCLPPGLDTTSHQYNEFVNEFQDIEIEYNPYEKLVGSIIINHGISTYKFSALVPFLNALKKYKKCNIIPYCGYEGYPDNALPSKIISLKDN